MGDESVKIDEDLFLTRLTKLHGQFMGKRELFGDSPGSLLIIHGKPVPERQEEPHAVSLQKHLLGYEFPDTIMLLTPKSFVVHATAKKLEYLKGAQVKAASGACPVTLEFLVREKGDANKPNNERLIAIMQEAGGAVSRFASDFTATSPLMSAFVEEMKAAGLTDSDGTRGVEAAFAVKDDAALEQVTKAGHLTARVARNAFVKEMERVIQDEDKAATNASIAAKVMTSVDDLKSLGIKIDTENFDFALPPVVQSGGVYNIPGVFKADAASDARPFSPDVIVFSQAMKYKAHSAFVARTFFVDPSPSQTKAYDAILNVHALLIDQLKPGAVIANVAKAAQDLLMSEGALPAEARLRPNFGSGSGLRPTDRHLVINTKNQTVVEAGMVFTVAVGVTDIKLEDPPKKSSIAMSKIDRYAILVADTVVVQPASGAGSSAGATLVTDKVPSERLQVVYSLEEDEEDDKAARAAARAAAAAEGPTRATRGAAKKAEVEANVAERLQREQRQLELLQKRKAEARKKAGGDDDAVGGAGDKDLIASAPDIEAYSGAGDLPKGVRPNQISVDKSRDAVLLPLFGSLVPFHVSTIKSVVKSEEGPKAFLRINFYAPGAAPGKDCAPSMQAALARYGEAIFVRTLNFMSRDHRNMNNVVAMIKAMQKKIKTERDAEAQRAGLVEQPRLVLTRDAKYPRLQDLNMWPSVSGRKTVGTLEAHTNGLRFVSNKGEKVEIIYANIAHGVFQPCDREHVVLIHFHLKHAIMIGKKKYRDVQFFTEVVEASQAIDGRGRADFDADELGDEERERRIRQDMNRAFKKFAERVEEVAGKDTGSAFSRFDVPQRGIAFPGSVGREMVTVLPCSEALVSLVDKPPFVGLVHDIEHVHFERVNFSNKTFDMVLIFKAGSREKGQDEWVRVSSIPRIHLDAIKAWLCDIAEVTYTEGAQGLDWKEVLPTIVRQDNFWLSEDDDGEAKPVGWEFLGAGGDGDGGSEGEEEESGSEYSEDEDSSEEEEDEDDDLDEYVDSDEDDESEYDEDDDESAEDWDELDAKAEKEDRKRKREEDEEDAKARKKYEKNKKKARRGGDDD